MQKWMLNSSEKGLVNKMKKRYWEGKRKKLYRLCKNFWIMSMIAGSVILVVLLYRTYLLRVPDFIYIKKGETEELDYHVPASGQIIGEKSVPVSLNQKVTLSAGDMMSQYKMELKLFGVIPFKDVNIEVIENQKITPAGLPIGIYVKTKGVLVIDVGEFEGMDGNKKAPSKYILQPGDYVLAMDGETVKGKKQIMQYITDSRGKSIMLTIARREDTFDVSVKPEQMETGEYKIGVWLRDSAQGIGTMTYVDENYCFGALGHGINDMDTSTLLRLDTGLLYETDIIGIRKGERGNPGELTGFIEYAPDYVVGVITENSTKGVYGMTSEDILKQIKEEPLEIGLKQDVVLGPAQIYCTIEEEPDYYDVEITGVTYDSNHVNKQISLKVTDERLLQTTGGIIQGMSGACLIQNDKIIGAVTHVLVNDPTRGYGIFIEDMLNHRSM